jgi:hypothetical protein
MSLLRHPQVGNSPFITRLLRMEVFLLSRETSLSFTDLMCQVVHGWLVGREREAADRVPFGPLITQWCEKPIINAP